MRDRVQYNEKLSFRTKQDRLVQEGEVREKKNTGRVAADPDFDFNN